MGWDAETLHRVWDPRREKNFPVSTARIEDGEDLDDPQDNVNQLDDNDTHSSGSNCFGNPIDGEETALAPNYLRQDNEDWCRVSNGDHSTPLSDEDLYGVSDGEEPRPNLV